MRNFVNCAACLQQMPLDWIRFRCMQRKVKRSIGSGKEIKGDRYITDCISFQWLRLRSFSAHDHRRCITVLYVRKQISFYVSMPLTKWAADNEKKGCRPPHRAALSHLHFACLLEMACDIYERHIFMTSFPKRPQEPSAQSCLKAAWSTRCVLSSLILVALLELLRHMQAILTTKLHIAFVRQNSEVKRKMTSNARQIIKPQICLETHHVKPAARLCSR